MDILWYSPRSVEKGPNSLLDQLVSGGLALLLDKLFKLWREEGEAGWEKILQSDKPQRWEAETRQHKGIFFLCDFYSMN